MTFERITTADVRVGDRIARTRNDTFRKVIHIQRGTRAAWLTMDGGLRIRPRHEAKLWREVNDQEVSHGIPQRTVR